MRHLVLARTYFTGIGGEDVVRMCWWVLRGFLSYHEQRIKERFLVITTELFQRLWGTEVGLVGVGVNGGTMMR